MARHTVEYDELNGYIAEVMIAASSRESKRLSVLTTIGETSTSSFRVYNDGEQVHHDYDSYGDALLAYNTI